MPRHPSRIARIKALNERMIRFQDEGLGDRLPQVPQDMMMDLRSIRSEATSQAFQSLGSKRGRW